MSDKLELMFDKVEKVLERMEKLKDENSSLKRENDHLKTQLANIHKEYNSLKLDRVDQDDRIRSKLVTILTRLDQLEELAG
jgi:FtsZ-binding cell division protein ZapB